MCGRRSVMETGRSALHLFAGSDGDRDQGGGVTGVRPPDPLVDGWDVGPLTQQSGASTQVDERLGELPGDRE
jgi:hypothetical protein